MKYLNKEEIEKLPNEVQEEIYHTLKAYNEVNIIYENGGYNVNTYTMISSKYAIDYKFIGVVKKEDIYTEEEMIINDVESFHDYPSNYKGKKDYTIFDKIKGNYKVKFEFDTSGNLKMI